MLVRAQKRLPQMVRAGDFGQPGQCVAVDLRQRRDKQPG